MPLRNYDLHLPARRGAAGYRSPEAATEATENSSSTCRSACRIQRFLLRFAAFAVPAGTTVDWWEERGDPEQGSICKYYSKPEIGGHMQIVGSPNQGLSAKFPKVLCESSGEASPPPAISRASVHPLKASDAVAIRCLGSIFHSLSWARALRGREETHPVCFQLRLAVALPRLCRLHFSWRRHSYPAMALVNNWINAFCYRCRKCA